MIESRVKAAMKAKGITVRELSQVTGVAPRTIMRARGPLIDRRHRGHHRAQTNAGAHGSNGKDDERRWAGRRHGPRAQQPPGHHHAAGSGDGAQIDPGESSSAP